MTFKKYICQYQDWRIHNVMSFFIVESDSLVHAIRDARAHVRSLNETAGFKCCYLYKVNLSRNEALK